MYQCVKTFKEGTNLAKDYNLVEISLKQQWNVLSDILHTPLIPFDIGI